MNVGVMRCLRGFYSTYEELKLLIGFVLTVGIERFYSTYEELKQVNILKVLCENFWFLQYLWGIETYISYFLTISHYLFLQYLWGIETWIG